MPFIIILLVFIVLLGWVVSTYNFFVGSKARVAAAKQEIANQLKRQSDLIPNLEASAKGYLKHEKGIFTDLADARKAVSAAIKSGDLGEMARAGSKVSAIVPRLQIAVEDNPEIKGAEVVRPLMDELRDTADKVMYARRLLIDLTADYNVKRVSFPSSIIANMFGVTEIKGMEMSDETIVNTFDSSEAKTPKVNL